ncbi:ComEA family DNA-binding protein [Paenibacillus sp. KS-LC4]|uniref:ComEA family DNA-binding protein n=1 Tax=Paenibacillus sp. KS-LC4 TaxID=2979727 RepID=UPI0030D53118
MRQRAKEKQDGKGSDAKRTMMTVCLLLACGLLGAAIFMPKEQAPSGWTTLNEAVEAVLPQDVGSKPGASEGTRGAGEGSSIGKQADGEGQQMNAATNGSSGKQTSNGVEDGGDGGGKSAAGEIAGGTSSSRVESAEKMMPDGGSVEPGVAGEAGAGTSNGIGRHNSNENGNAAGNGSSDVGNGQSETAEVAATSSMNSGKLDINRATAEELDGLKGIGPAKAKAIVENREKNGRFTSVDDLRRVKGIGPKLLQGMKDSIVANP